MISIEQEKFLAKYIEARGQLGTVLKADLSVYRKFRKWLEEEEFAEEKAVIDEIITLILKGESIHNLIDGDYKRGNAQLVAYKEFRAELQILAAGIDSSGASVDGFTRVGFNLPDSVFTKLKSDG